MGALGTLKRLHALATSPSTPDGERQAALKALERILQANPDLQRSMAEPEPESISKDIRFKQWQEEWVIYYAAWFLGLQAHGLRSVAANRPVKHVRVIGDPRLVKVVQQLVKDYKPKLQDAMEMFMHGWLHKTFPKPPSGKKSDSEPLTPEQEAALFAGHNLGTQASNGFAALNASNPKAALSGDKEE